MGRANEAIEQFLFTAKRPIDSSESSMTRNMILSKSHLHNYIYLFLIVSSHIYILTYSYCMHKLQSANGSSRAGPRKHGTSQCWVEGTTYPTLNPPLPSTIRL